MHTGTQSLGGQNMKQKVACRITSMLEAVRCGQLLLSRLDHLIVADEVLKLGGRESLKHVAIGVFILSFTNRLGRPIMRHPLVVGRLGPQINFSTPVQRDCTQQSFIRSANNLRTIAVDAEDG